MYHLNDLLNLVAREGAEELRLEPGRPPVMIVHGRAQVIDPAPLANNQVTELFRSIATEDQRRELSQCGGLHFTFAAQHSARFSASVTLQGEDLALKIKNLGR